MVETQTPRIETKNATIRKTQLGYEDHGILTVSLGLDYGSAGQSFGGWALDSYKDHLKRRVGTQAGLDFIIAILKTLELTNWEDLPGRPLSQRSVVRADTRVVQEGSKWQLSTRRGATG